MSARLESSRWTGLTLTAAGILIGGALLTAAIVATLVGGGPISLGPYVIGAAAFVLCMVWWRPAVCAVFVLLFVEGYLRNRLNTPAVLLLKDVMLAAIYLRVFGERALRREPLVPATPSNLPLTVFVAIAGVQLVNPHISVLEQAIVGLRTWVYYVPLYFVGAMMLRSERDVQRFGWFLLACAVPICALAVYQYQIGPTAYAAQGEAFATATFVTRGESSWIFRPNATFSWPSHFAVFLVVVTLVAVGMLLASRARQRALLVLLLAMLVGVNLIEGQRTSYIHLALAALLVLALRRQFWAVPLAALAVVGVAWLVGEWTGSAGLERVRELAENRYDVIGARTDGFWMYWLEAVNASPIGLGAGATAIGTRHVAESIPLYIEVPLGKVVADLSLLGMAAYVWLFASLCLTTLRGHERAMRQGATARASLLAALLAYQLIIAASGYELAVAALTFWLLSGAAAALAAPATDDAARSARRADTRPLAGRSRWSSAS